MSARAFTHVSIEVSDIDAALRFYCERLGMRRVPSPDFPESVEWLALGDDRQLHLVRGDGPPPAHHHFGVDVDSGEFAALYAAAVREGFIDTQTFSPTVRELVDGSAQMYLRDPSGNLLEVNCRDASAIDRSVVTEIRRLTDDRRQDAEAARAQLYPPS